MDYHQDSPVFWSSRLKDEVLRERDSFSLAWRLSSSAFSSLLRHLVSTLIASAFDMTLRAVGMSIRPFYSVGCDRSSLFWSAVFFT